ncbi:MAG: DUF4402 domain-containing protein [Taibaiella sp.]|nr:DUF4402 domain-containing protein [Taibaiella sp.]
MKNKNVLLTMVIAIFAINLQVFAQQTATASLTTTVITPISLSKNVDMNFGNAAVSATVGGTLVLEPTGTRFAVGGGVTLPATSGAVSAAGFTVTGMPGYTFSISLPGSSVIYGPGAANLVISAFTSTPAATGTLGAGGSQIINVGATLSIPAAQTAGVYNNADALPVTVNYD